jgi:hypothetical protein
MPWPWPGGYYDQPCVFAQARRIIDGELAIIMAQERRNNG